MSQITAKFNRLIIDTETMFLLTKMKKKVNTNEINNKWPNKEPNKERTKTEQFKKKTKDVPKMSHEVPKCPTSRQNVP